MASNPSGGVAACLVWNKDDRKQSDRHGPRDATDTCSNADDDAQRLIVNPQTYRDVNVRLYTDLLEMLYLSF